VTWRRWGALLAAFGSRDVASLGAGRIDELALDVPKSGQSPGARRRRWRPRVMVVVVGRDGGTSQRVTFVTFQPRLLDLATRGRLLLIGTRVVAIKFKLN
jgi:hypothetical protein